jgi:phosphate transport system substrate-binding protein
VAPPGVAPPGMAPSGVARPARARPRLATFRVEEEAVTMIAWAAGFARSRAAGAGARIAAVLSLAAIGLVAAPPPAGASNYVAVSGSGSSWSAVAIDQWAEDVRANGLVVNYNPDGSAAGRADYMANQDDFAGSDPPFRDGTDKLGGTGAENPSVGYSYIPDTAGGTAFIYHLTVAGHLIRNLRLSGPTVFKIFTGQITNWDDPAITHDYGARLPSLPITPVIRSDGSGATFFFTRWMSHVFPAQWNAFCRRVHPGIHPPCGQTEFYPQFGNAKAENGSNNVVTYITSTYGNGSIGYDEYAYALNSHYPVVKLLNAGGYYVLPSASNVAVALTRAVINENSGSRNFLQQNLDKVYTYQDPRSYPLSSYSYLIVPRSGSHLPTNFSTAKGRSLSTYINFMLCAGQRQMAVLGYSPLPRNLVVGGLLQNGRIPGHVPIPSQSSLASCHNPTMQNGQNILLKTAPMPSPCDKAGEPLDCIVVNGKATTPGAGATGSASAGPTASAAVPTASTGPLAAAPSAAAGPVTGVTVNLASANRANEVTLAAITADAIILAVAVPPSLAAWLRRRRGQAHG